MSTKQNQHRARPATSYVIWALETHFKSAIQFIPHGLFVSAAVTSESWGMGGATYLKRQFRGEKHQTKWISFCRLPFVFQFDLALALALALGLLTWPDARHVSRRVAFSACSFGVQKPF